MTIVTKAHNAATGYRGDLADQHADENDQLEAGCDPDEVWLERTEPIRTDQVAFGGDGVGERPADEAERAAER